jgi:UDP-N-acetylmuramyl pentapeptide phosphotransferase/UDP-N-acetylglucosamine-1-phosphate transferase
MGLTRVVGAALAGAAATVAVRRALDARLPGGAERWTRTNHRGEPISLLEGPAVAAGLVAGALTGARGRGAAAAAVATAGAGAFGLVDDLTEDTTTRTKGLKGHLGALAQGRLTTGGLKVLGIGATSVLAAAIGTRRTGGPGGWAADVVVNGALVAGTANLLNLLDLRPGRALKSAAALAAVPVGGPAAATCGAVAGAAAAAWGGDLGERDMLGDGGANALGALVGTRLALGLPRPLRLAALAGVVGLTLASERVSFTQVIERTPWLRAVDELGRRPRTEDPAA